MVLILNAIPKWNRPTIPNLTKYILDSYVLVLSQRLGLSGPSQNGHSSPRHWGPGHFKVGWLGKEKCLYEGNNRWGGGDGYALSALNALRTCETCAGIKRVACV